MAIEPRYSFIGGNGFRLCEHDRRDLPDRYQAGRAAFPASLTPIESCVARQAS
jgi:hypothetical protein